MSSVGFRPSGPASGMHKLQYSPQKSTSHNGSWDWSSVPDSRSQQQRRNEPNASPSPADGPRVKFAESEQPKHNSASSSSSNSPTNSVGRGTPRQRGKPRPIPTAKTFDPEQAEIDEAWRIRKRERVHRRMDRVKLKHRSVLKLPDWQRYELSKSFPKYVARTVESLEDIQLAKDRRDGQLSRWIRHSELSGRVPASPLPQTAKLKGVVDGIDRIHCRDFSPDRFRNEFEIPNRPVVIDGLTEGWGAERKWTEEALSSGEYRERLFKCGEDDKGYSVKVKLKTFLRYMRYNDDDSPLYVFDSAFDEDKVAKKMLKDYSIPQYFTDDLFRLVGERRRPPYRWFLIGPERSGSSLHIDPLATSAWNTLLAGRKQWVLFRPGANRTLVKGKDLKQRGEDGEAATYFTKILPRIRQRELNRPEGSDVGMVEFIQYPGETVFIPGGWWHAVLNLDHTIAVTQNFVSRVNFPNVWVKTRTGRKHMAKRWLDVLEQDYPQLAAQARAINKSDGFQFVFGLSKKSQRKKALEMKKSRDRPPTPVKLSGSRSSNSTPPPLPPPAFSDTPTAAAEQPRPRKRKHSHGAAGVRFASSPPPALPKTPLSPDMPQRPNSTADERSECKRQKVERE